MSMQTFYTKMHSPQSNVQALLGLFAIARSSLKDVLAVRSELAWDPWGAS